MNMQQFFFRRAMALAAIVAVTTVVAVSAAKAAPVLLVESGKLIGANGVDVAGSLYDVRFVDGSCAAAFGTCEVSSFDFSTLAQTVAATQALEAQVFIGEYDDRPELTRGCVSRIGCEVFTPFGLVPGSSLVLLSSFLNQASGLGPDFVFEGVSGDRAGSGSNTWARWTLSPTTSVPTPASLLLAASALGLAALSTRTSRRRRG